MVPFHPVPLTVAPDILNTTVNEVMGLPNEVLAIRTAPLKPPCQELVASTLAVTPVALPVVPDAVASSLEVWGPHAASPTRRVRSGVHLRFLQGTGDPFVHGFTSERCCPSPGRVRNRFAGHGHEPVLRTAGQSCER